MSSPLTTSSLSDGSQQQEILSHMQFGCDMLLEPVVPPSHDDGEPRDDDILCGRDKAAFEWKGNKEFREMIWTTLPKYTEADTRLKKSKVVKKLVEDLYEQGRRFLKKSKEGEWLEIGKDKAREKTAHAFRDATSADRRRIHPKGYRRTSKSKKQKEKAVDASANKAITTGKLGPVSPRSTISLTGAASTQGELPIKTPTLYRQDERGHCHGCGQPNTSNHDGSVVFLNCGNSPLDESNFTIADFEEQNLWFDERINKGQGGNMTWSDALDTFNDMAMDRAMAEEQQLQHLQQQQQLYHHQQQQHHHQQHHHLQNYHLGHHNSHQNHHLGHHHSLHHTHHRYRHGMAHGMPHMEPVMLKEDGEHKRHDTGIVRV